MFAGCRILVFNFEDTISFLRGLHCLCYVKRFNFDHFKKCISLKNFLQIWCLIAWQCCVSLCKCYSLWIPHHHFRCYFYQFCFSGLVMHMLCLHSNSYIFLDILNSVYFCFFLFVCVFYSL